MESELAVSDTAGIFQLTNLLPELCDNLLQVVGREHKHPSVLQAKIVSWYPE